MEAFMAWLKSVNDVVWGPGMLVLLVGTGLYLTVGLKFFTFRNFFRGLKNLWAGRSNQSEQGEISPFNALMTALAADIGTGNIVGVSTRKKRDCACIFSRKTRYWLSVHLN